MIQRSRHHRGCFSLKSGLGFTGCLLLASASVHSQPADYYLSAEGLSGADLQQQLHTIIDDHVRISYAGLWIAFPELYEDPVDPGRLILFYTEASWDVEDRDRGSGTFQYWNREHLWPRSYGVGDSGKDSSDMFHVVPANKAINADRSNKYFDVANPADGSYENPAYSGGGLDTVGIVEDFNSWEPDDPQKGWVARSMFYMATRYDYLSLGDVPDEDAGRMGKLSVLLDWNREFPPNAKETTFNEDVFMDWQYNRNPYIDHPEFADAVHIDGPSWGGWRLAHFSLAELGQASVSGDMADPDGDGMPNLFERARYSDPQAAEGGPPLEFDVQGNALELRFLRCRDSADLLANLILERAAGLSGDWTAVSLAGADFSPRNEHQEEVILTVDAPDPASPVFYRLRVERE